MLVCQSVLLILLRKYMFVTVTGYKPKLVVIIVTAVNALVSPQLNLQLAHKTSKLKTYVANIFICMSLYGQQCATLQLLVPLRPLSTNIWHDKLNRLHFSSLLHKHRSHLHGTAEYVRCKPQHPSH
jgi:hypothetical protein